MSSPSSDHRLVRVDRHHRPRGVGGRIKVRGGSAYGCTGCGWFTDTGVMVEAAKSHRRHLAELARDELVTAKLAEEGLLP